MKEEYADHVLNMTDDHLYGQDDQIFSELIRRAGVNMDKYLEANDEYRYNTKANPEPLTSDDFEEVERMYEEVNDEMDPIFPAHVDVGKLNSKYNRRMDAVDETCTRLKEKIFKNKELT